MLTLTVNVVNVAQFQVLVNLLTNHIFSKALIQISVKGWSWRRLILGEGLKYHKSAKRKKVLVIPLLSRRLGQVWLCMAMYGYAGLCRAMYGCVWLCMAM